MWVSQPGRRAGSITDEIVAKKKITNKRKKEPKYQSETDEVQR
jgi:hypothetical protein